MLEPHRQRRDVEFDREHLCEALHQVLLGDRILAVDDLLQDLWEHNIAVHGQINAFKLGQLREVGPNQDP